MALETEGLARFAVKSDTGWPFRTQHTIGRSMSKLENRPLFISSPISWHVR